MSEQSFTNCVLIGEGAKATANDQLVIALDPDNQIRTVFESFKERTFFELVIKRALAETGNSNIITITE
ncbi:MAG: hypothetical protein GY861_06645 [bacterium]|nr:hypothetical protein [bacterium]